MATEMEHDAASRIVNAWWGGDPSETLCSHIWRERWQRPWLWILIWQIDRVAVRDYGECPGHCRRAAANHRLLKAAPDDRVRLSDGA